MLKRRIQVCYNPHAAETTSGEKIDDQLVAAYTAATEIMGKLATEVGRDYATMYLMNTNLRFTTNGNCHCLMEPTETGGTKLLRITVSENGEQKIHNLITTETISEFLKDDANIRSYFLPELKPVEN